jgi:sugar O-acyltransferase (sialic acid O-acetyltransferase NeuD family)
VRFVLFAVSTPFAAELWETGRRCGFECVAVANMPGLPIPPELEPVLDADGLDPALLGLRFCVPQTAPRHRHAALADARRRGFDRGMTLVDPTAAVASTAEMGDDTYVGTASVVAAGAVLGAGVLVNRSCSIGHHTRLGDYVCTGPGVVTAGSCRIERGAFLGAGAVLVPEVTVGRGAVVGAGAVVIEDVAAGDVVVGNPARVIRSADPASMVPDG